MQETCLRSVPRLALLCVLSIAGCQSLPERPTSDTPPVLPVFTVDSMQDIHREPFIAYPQPENFTVCHGHSCSRFSRISLSEDDWLSIKEIFRDIRDPASERHGISQAVALFESMVGRHAGTAADRGQNRSGLGRAGQLDCVDEATNTTVYLSMLQARGLLRWHRVGSRQSRGITTLQILHWTAVIRETRTGLRYAVDSWFLDNGAPPFVVPLAEWDAGWEPAQ